jgi:hypothetical protein
MSSVPFEIKDISLVGIWGIDSKDSSFCLCKRHLLAPTIEEIKDKKEKLSEKAMALASKVYEEAAKANAPKEEEKEDKKSDDAVEAEFVE